MAAPRTSTRLNAGALTGPVLRALGTARLSSLARLRELPPRDTTLLIGPTNTAGQAAAWAGAARRHLPDVQAWNLTVRRSWRGPATAFPSDLVIGPVARHGDLVRSLRPRLLDAVTHVIFESGRPVLEVLYPGTMLDDVPAFEAAGAMTAALFHGSDIRSPRRHDELDPVSPFPALDPDYVARLEATTSRNQALLTEFGGPVLISTPDLRPHLPDALWLPVVVDAAAFASTAPVLERQRPIVLHAPSNPRLKGTEAIETAISPLHERGVVEYRRLGGLSRGELRRQVREADVVIDQVVLGNPGVLLAEAMAAGRLAVAHLTASTRAAMRAAGRELEADPGEPPVIEMTPGTVADVLAAVLDDRVHHAAIAARGPAWATAHHDGRRSAAVLDRFLGRR